MTIRGPELSASSHPMHLGERLPDEPFDRAPARTVCRMTVLKGVAENDEACQGYADLINISRCDFVEIKAATYSPVWDKRNSGLSRDSVPRHDDVLQLARRLVSKLPMHLGPPLGTFRLLHLCQLPATLKKSAIKTPKLKTAKA